MKTRQLSLAIFITLLTQVCLASEKSSSPQGEEVYQSKSTPSKSAKENHKESNKIEDSKKTEVSKKENSEKTIEEKDVLEKETKAEMAPSSHTETTLPEVKTILPSTEDKEETIDDNPDLLTNKLVKGDDSPAEGPKGHGFIWFSIIFLTLLIAIFIFT